MALSRDGRRARNDVFGTSRKFGEVLNARGGGGAWRFDRLGVLEEDADPLAIRLFDTLPLWWASWVKLSSIVARLVPFEDLIVAVSSMYDSSDKDSRDRPGPDIKTRDLNYKSQKQKTELYGLNGSEMTGKLVDRLQSGGCGGRKRQVITVREPSGVLMGMTNCC